MATHHDVNVVNQFDCYLRNKTSVPTVRTVRTDRYINGFPSVSIGDNHGPFWNIL